MIKCFKIIIWIVLTAIFCLTANAQSYSIRVRHNTNIRVQPSLNEALLESVPAGTVLNVISKFNRWFKVNRGSGAWMASWVSHERVAQLVAQPAATSVNVDNCCYVDRHCQADHEWEAGYWAYQNGQCGAPASGGYHAPVSIPAGANNCCQIGWNCQADHEWIYGQWAFQHNRCTAAPSTPPAYNYAIPASQGHGHIHIVQLTDGFAAMVQNGWELLRTSSPEWYLYTINAITEIRECHNCTSGVAGATGRTSFHHAPHSIRPYIRQDDYTMAEFFVHEAAHVYQDREGRWIGGAMRWLMEYEAELYNLDFKLQLGCVSANCHLSDDFLSDPMNRALWWWIP